MAQLVLNLVVSDQMGCSSLNRVVEFGDGLSDLNCLSHPSKLSSQVERNKSFTDFVYVYEFLVWLLPVCFD